MRNFTPLASPDTIMIYKEGRDVRQRVVSPCGSRILSNLFRLHETGSNNWQTKRA